MSKQAATSSKSAPRNASAPARGVTLVNRRLAELYGKGQIICTRGRGYYYFRGEHDGALFIPSLYWFRIELSDVDGAVEHVTDAIKPVQA